MRLRVLPPPFYRSLRLQMMAWLGTLLLVVFVVMGYLIYTFLRMHQESLWSAHLQDINRQAVSNIESYLRVYERALRTLSVLNPQDEHTFAAAQQILKEYTAFKEIVWVDEAGRVILHEASGAPIMGNLFTVRQSLWFQTALRGERYLSGAQPVENEGFILLMALPGERGGVLAGVISLDTLQHGVKPYSSDPLVNTWIVDQNGEILVHPDLDWIRVSIREKPLYVGLNLKGAVGWSGRVTGLRGEEVLLVAAPVGETSWIVFSEVPFSRVRSASWQAVFVLGVGILMFIIGIAFWSRWYLKLLIFTPLSNLRQAIGQMERGECNINLNLDREDELGDLASAFQTMFQQIQEREAQLEERHQALELETARRKHAMLELQRMAEQLEERVKVRTAELEREIAERRQTEQELRLNLQRLELLNRLLNVHNPENMLEEMCRVLAQALNASLTLLLIREHSNARLQVRGAFLQGEASLMERMDQQSDALFRVFHGNHNRVSSIAISRLDSQPPFLSELVNLQVEHLLLLRQTPAGAAEAFLVVGRGRHQPFEPVEIQTLEVVASGVLQVIELALLYASLNDELTERRRIETLLVHQNTRDTLTGLYNRRVFEERIGYRAPHTMPVCLIVLDLDHLKRVNDTFGHTSGDEYIRLVAQAIQASVRSEDMAARIGGDEFVVILNGADESAGEAVMQRIQESLQSMLDPQNPVARMVRVSMGLAVSQPGEPLLETYRRADTAMYAQKQAHRREETADYL
ncbi:sensor domain-containing diguanylate cyclase [Anaerolinea thermophila]|uniref:Diguanylate cyclase n=1 Tax=Anaerolinea thermophila (strain DSM 14523 / JCM 11388 / NBRC 100420 / UNI-1) TaxID=926569 RepID=E8MZP1_ANATU|nr:sensor domain-containing diguanylate cyclase [Anaerolinea thermophila]BAJ64589.1 hypothetical protein ANT_25630 [Anaerolinea thermophila UNI-1]